MTSEHPKTVAVIGAGIAGLVTAKTLTADGFDVRVFEKDPDLGGTWAASRTYPGLRTNNTKQTYEFSDHPYPDDTELSPRADQVRGYLESYADRFGIRQLIRFNQEVVSVARSAVNKDALTVRWQSSTDGSAGDEFDVDFVVVCNGVFHRPQMPDVPGRDRFAGKVLHSSEVTASTYGTNDRVVIVGGGKSAFDCATYAARQGHDPTLVFRRAQWMAPRFLPGGKIPGDWLVTSRFLASLLRYHSAGTGGRLLHSVGRPLVRLWWTVIGLGWQKDLQIPAGMKPSDKLPSGIEKIGVGGDFYEVVNAGQARAVKGAITRFTEDGIELADGTALPADVVVFATGWHQSIAFLSEDLRREIAGQGYIRLFRQILPPTAQNIGFVGYASSVACQLTAEVGAHWLSDHFLGSLPLPSVQAMNHEIDRVHAWADEVLPNRGTEGFIGPYLSPYIDELMRDMQLPVRRAPGFFTEYFGVFRASRYAGLTAERRQARGRA